ncbi:hypothetical protein [Streptomyces sp. NPDC047928]|uniref:hypothetical protein n=1 Tax=unclassified Streptomyces TaxID=2593676 RepID=UPI00371AF146
MSGSLWLRPGPDGAVGGDTLPCLPRPRPAPAWAAADPVDALAERLEDLIAVAVHPDEIAALLESDGMNDEHIRLTYGRQDSFALAEELYARVERRHPGHPGHAPGTGAPEPVDAGAANPGTGNSRTRNPGTGNSRTAKFRTGTFRTRNSRIGDSGHGAPGSGGPRSGDSGIGDSRIGDSGIGDSGHGAPRSGGPRSGDSGIGDSGHGAPRSGGPRSGGPRSGGPRSGGPRSGGPRPAVASRLAETWSTGLARCLLRGLVFALPGLGYVLGAPLFAGPAGTLGLPAGTVPLLAGAVTGWMWNQALSHRAYTWLGLGDRPAAARALLTGAPAGALLGAVVAAVAASPGQWGAVAFAAGQSVYLAAATVLLVLDRAKALLGALLPLVAGAPVALAFGLPGPVRAALLLAAPLAAAVLAARTLLTGTAPPPPGRGGPPLAASAPYGLFGLGTGLLVLYTVIGDVVAHGPEAAVAAPSAVALTLSMGPAEWLLHRFRVRSRAGLRATTGVGAFRRVAAAAFARCLTGYLAALVAIAAAGTLLWPGAPDLGGVRLVTLLLIGTVLWSALLLQSFGAVTGAALVCGAAAAAHTVALAAGTGDARLVGTTVACAAALALLALSGVVLGRVSTHRA